MHRSTPRFTLLETMDYWKKVKTGISQTGVLGVGLFGLYLGHKQRIPEFMNIISYGVTFVGIYVLATYLLEDEYEDSDDSDKNIHPGFQQFVSETPKIKRKNTRMRRKFLDEYDKHTKWVFEKRGGELSSSSDAFSEQESFNFQEILREASSLPILPQIVLNDPNLIAFHECSRRLQKLSAEVKEANESAELPSSGVLAEDVELSSADGSIITEFNQRTSLQHLIEKVKLGDIRQIHAEENPPGSSSRKFEELDTD